MSFIREESNCFWERFQRSPSKHKPQTTRYLELKHSVLTLLCVGASWNLEDNSHHSSDTCQIHKKQDY